MEALQLVSIYIFNGMSRLVHRRRSLPGRPFQLPYPTSYRQMTSQNYGPNEMSAEDVITPDNVPAIRQSSGSPGAARPTEAAAAAGDHTTTPVIEARPGAASQLLSDEYRLKRFMERLEEETLKLLEPTEEGIKVPRPVPYPAYLARPPEIPISQTYTSVLRQLYNERRAAYSRPDFPAVVRQHPKKPKVPPYLPSDIVELRQKTVKVLLTSQNSDLENGDEHSLVVAFGRAAKRRRSAKGAH